MINIIYISAGYTDSTFYEFIIYDNHCIIFFLISTDILSGKGEGVVKFLLSKEL